MAYSRITHGGGAVPTTLVGDITSGATSLNLAASNGWPDGVGGPFYLVIDPGLANEEKILATTRTATTLNSLTRGVDGTSASAHSSSAVIVHCFTATEADEANQAAHQTLGAVTTKGDLLVASGAQTLVRFPAGADNSVPIYDSSQASGVRAAQITANQITAGTITSAQLAANSVTTAKVADANVTTAKIADGAVTTPKLSGAYKVGGFSGTTDSNGIWLFPHAAAFTPTRLLAFLDHIGGQDGVIMSRQDLDATNVQLRFVQAAGGNAVGIAVAGTYLVFP